MVHFFKKGYRVENRGYTLGFTLIEMIVALGIFSIVAVVALGALTKIIVANKKAQTMQSAINNITYGLESVSREMRTGRYYYCNTSGTLPPATLASNSIDSTCAGLADEGDDIIVAFQSTRSANKSGGGTCNLITAYHFGEAFNGPSGLTVVEKAEQKVCEATLNDVDFSPVIDPQVTITDYSVKAIATAGATVQKHPMIYIQLAGYVGVTERERTLFNVETAVSARSQ